MKSRSFPKLDKQPRRKPKRSNRSTQTAKDVWIGWRMQLGAGRKEANRLWKAYQEWCSQEATNPRARVLTVEPWQDWEREFRAFLDEMPRKPFKFLAMVAANEKRRAQQAAVAERRARNRQRYARAYSRGSL